MQIARNSASRIAAHCATSRCVLCRPTPGGLETQLKLKHNAAARAPQLVVPSVSSSGRSLRTRTFVAMAAVPKTQVAVRLTSFDQDKIDDGAQALNGQSRLTILWHALSVQQQIECRSDAMGWHLQASSHLVGAASFRAQALPMSRCTKMWECLSQVRAVERVWFRQASGRIYLSETYLIEIMLTFVLYSLLTSDQRPHRRWRGAGALYAAPSADI